MRTIRQDIDQAHSRPKNSSKNSCASRSVDVFLWDVHRTSFRSGLVYTYPKPGTKKPHNRSNSKLLLGRCKCNFFSKEHILEHSTTELVRFTMGPRLKMNTVIPINFKFSVFMNCNTILCNIAISIWLQTLW